MCADTADSGALVAKSKEIETPGNAERRRSRSEVAVSESPPLAMKPSVGTTHLPRSCSAISNTLSGGADADDDVPGFGKSSGGGGAIVSSAKRF